MNRLSVLAGSLFLFACPVEDNPNAASTEGSTETGGVTTMPTGGEEAEGGPGGEAGSTAGGATAESGEGTADSTADGAGTESTAGTADGGTDGTGNDPGSPLDCGGTIYACGDGKDNDGDGKIDLFDPECTGPCDDDESSFATGIPGDNMDCKQDCFFDGNSGQGDDGCIWSLRCDPENPGANIGCEYTGGNNCDNMPPNQDPDCIEFCIPFVPPGCDCFGCCLVTDDEGNDVSIFLNSHPDCALDNLEACESCTFNDNCGNPCDGCELCFGQEELPPECDSNECDFGDPCTTVADCPTDWYCLQDCCYPPPPG